MNKILHLIFADDDDTAVLHEKLHEPFTCPWKSDVPRGRPFVVVYTPWKRPTRVVSSHTTASAALKAAAKNNAEFRARYPGGFGHQWAAAKVE